VQNIIENLSNEKQNKQILLASLQRELNDLNQSSIEANLSDAFSREISEIENKRNEETTLVLDQVKEELRQSIDALTQEELIVAQDIANTKEQLESQDITALRQKLEEFKSSNIQPLENRFILEQEAEKVKNYKKQLLEQNKEHLATLTTDLYLYRSYLATSQQLHSELESIHAAQLNVSFVFF
jgi:type I site-specific restriction-modification system R (restriction) subunit